MNLLRGAFLSWRLCSVGENLEGRGETRAKAEQRRARCLILKQDKTHCSASQFSAFHAISCQKPFGIFFDHLAQALKGRRVFKNVTCIILKYLHHIYISFIKENIRNYKKVSVQVSQHLSQKGVQQLVL